MTATAALLLVVGALLVLAALAVALSREARVTALVYPAAAVMSATGFLVALAALLGNASSQLVLPLGLPWIGAHFRVDALSAFFLAVVNLGGLAASVYAVGYGRHEEAPHRVLPFYPAFLAGMNLVVLAADAFSFLLAWEFMSLASWAMVLAHHRDAQNRRAATVYLVMASFGTMALLLAFGLLAGAGGDYTFAAIRAADRAPLTASLALLFVLVGAGSKAGLVPLHVWLPLAHPAAPSHVSALMSGVMTKVAVYAVLRILFDLLGGIEWWWATIVLLLGGVTAAVGVLYALMQNDLKRLLAGAYGLGLEAEPLDRFLKNATLNGIVIDNQNTLDHWHSYSTQLVTDPQACSTVRCALPRTGTSGHRKLASSDPRLPNKRKQVLRSCALVGEIFCGGRRAAHISGRERASAAKRPTLPGRQAAFTRVFPEKWEPVFR